MSEFFFNNDRSSKRLFDYLGSVENDYQVPINLDGIAMDIGMCLGAFSLRYADQFTKIFGLEANYGNYHTMIRNLNSVGNVYTWNLAADNYSGLLRVMRPYNTNDVGSCSIARPSNHTPSDGCEQRVLSIDWDGWLELTGINDSPIDYLKCDIEGAEAAFLVNKDLSRVKYIGIELHPYFPQEIEELRLHIEKTHEQVFGKPGPVEHTQNRIYRLRG